MSVMYIRNEQTGEFEPVPSLVGPQGPPGANGDGAGTVTSVNKVAPDATGNVTLTAANVGARPDTWTPTASDVGALPSDGTAVNADKLNGKDAEYYATAEQLSALFLSPNYSARTVLFSEITTTSGNSTYTGTMDEDGYICAYVNTGASVAYPFMRIRIDNVAVFENAKGMTSNYLYRTTPLFPVKKGMAVEIQLGDYSVGGSTVQVRFYGVNR